MAFSISKGRLLALDWDKKSLRMVLVRPRADGVDLLRAVRVAIPADVKIDDPAEFGAFVREAISRTHAGAKRAVLAIPRDHVVLHNLTLPPSTPEEIPALVQFQVAKELPFSPEQAAVDFVVNGEFDPKAQSSVLVSAVRIEVLNQYKAIADAAGLTVERIGLRPFANLIAITAGSAELAEKTFLIVEIGPQFTEIDIVRNGQILFSRSALVSLPEDKAALGEAITDSRIVTVKVHEREDDEASKQLVGDLMVEIVRSVEAYRATDPALNLDQIMVCGASGLEGYLVQALGARFATRAELYSPDRAMQLAPERARELGGFNAALGLAIGHSRKGLSGFDFLHPKKPISRRAMQMRKMPLAAAIAVLIIGSAVTFHFRFVKPKTDEARTLDLQRAKLKKEEEPIVKFKDQVESMEAWVESEQHWPTVLASVTEVFPSEKEGYVTRLDFEQNTSPKSALRDTSLRMRFRTLSLGTVNQLTSEMRKNGFLTVIPGKETPSENRDAYRYDSNVDAGVPLRRVEEGESAEAKPTAEHGVESKSSEAKPAEVKAAEVKPAESKTSEPKPAESNGPSAPPTPTSRRATP
ncbi:MAG TPA: pilus assembly protein PilM [Phycisphaerae bacterium]|nr:pilus assembly protein PilM [Phycisphaerae bacterium]